MIPRNHDPITTKRRPLLFMAVYLIGAVIVTLVLAGGSREGVFHVFQTFLLALVFLPYGLAVVLQAMSGGAVELIEPGPIPLPVNLFGYALIAVSYLASMLLPLAGCLTNSQRTFRLLFIVFLLLTIINLGGCSLAV